MSTLFVELDEVDANSKSPFAVFVCKPKHNENKTITCGLMLGFIKIKWQCKTNRKCFLIYEEALED